MKIIRIAVVLSLFLFSCAANGQGEDQSAKSQEISGKLEGGLRILSVDPGSGDLEYTIYRGDYIVFEDIDPMDFRVPELDVNESLPKPDGDKPYVKMKVSGDFDFTLGERRGTIHVLELTEPNYHEVTADEAAALLENVGPLILDVRTTGEFQQAHIAGANLLPVQILEENLETLASFKNEPLFVYCASGNRSTVASRLLIDAGFTNVYNLRYGIGDWVRKGYPVEN